MGIKNLSTYLHKNHPEIYKKSFINSFAGKRVAIDGHNWVYVTMSQAQKKILGGINPMEQELNRSEYLHLALSMGIDFILMWLQSGVTPVFVFDGEHPKEKDDTRKERRERKAKLLDEIDELKKGLESMDPLLKTPAMVEQLRNKMRQCINILGSDWNAFKQLISDLGIPYYQSNGDGEQLCCMLCLEGKVDAVYSSDSDNLAYGCPRVIVGPPMMMFDQVTREYQHQVTRIEILDVLEAMKISYPMFLEFCIMCGCDYNTNIPNIGPAKALKLIMAHETIDQLPEEYDRTPLTFERCREMFAYNPSETLYTEGHLDLELERLTDKGKDFLMSHGLITYLPRLVSIYNRIPHPSRVFVSQPPVTMFVSIRELY